MKNILISALLAILSSGIQAAAMRPNFVVILADKIGKDWFGCYGAEGGHTPEIDRLKPDTNASDRGQFIGMVRSMDAQVGRIVKELERLRINTGGKKDKKKE